MTNDTTLPVPWPHLSTPIVTDGGLETWLLFLRGVDLPAFAAYPLVGDPDGRSLLVEYYERYLAIAEDVGAAALLEAPTWRANPDWAAALGHDMAELGDFIDAGIGLMHQLRARHRGSGPVLVSAVVGPRGDGYRLDRSMSPDEAAEYHHFQIERSARAGADLVSALTMVDIAEAAGIALAASSCDVPSVISFTVETDGRLPSGVSLGDAISRTDDITGGAPHHYMVNCAHPTHFAPVLANGGGWTERIGGIRANASAASHAELDEMTELDDGDPGDLATWYVALRDLLPQLQVVGGCCGTDDRHVEAIARAFCAPGSAG